MELEAIENFKEAYYLRMKALSLDGTLPLKKNHKKQIDNCLENLYSDLYNGTKKLGLKGRAQPKFIDLTSILFLKEQNDFDAINFITPIRSENIQSILYEISSQKQNFSGFIESAANSGNPVSYASIFSRADSFEKARLLHSVIRGRNDLKKIREYEQSEKKQKIGKLLNDIVNNVKGSGKEFLKEFGPVLTPYSVNKIEQDDDGFYLKHFLKDIAKGGRKDFSKSLGEKGFSAVINGGKPFIVDIDSEYKINGCLPVYIINNWPDKSAGGFFEPVTKRLFAINYNGIKGTIQHETEHFIQDGFGLKDYSNLKCIRLYSDTLQVGAEYGAYLGEIRFSDNADAIKNIFELYSRMDDHYFADNSNNKKPSPHLSAMGAMFNLDTRDKSFFRDKKRIIGLHDEIYQKQLGVTYTELEKMVK